jgi:hypothetical protein
MRRTGIQSNGSAKPPCLGAW